MGETANGDNPQRRRLPYPAVCASCRISLSRGAEALWETREVGDKVIAPHDRLIPGTRGNIDPHLRRATGVWVVDAKA